MIQCWIDGQVLLSHGQIIEIRRGMREKKAGGYERKEVNEKEKETFKIDNMRDQFASFPDPHVDFAVFFPKDKASRQFVVIRVYEFEEVPIICIKNSSDTTAPTVYYRNNDRKVERGPISNSSLRSNPKRS